MSTNGRRALLRQEAVDARGHPRCDATAEEVRILSPNRTAESQGGCANRSVARFACVEPLPRFGFEIAIEVQAAESRAQLWILETPMLSWDRRLLLRGLQIQDTRNLPFERLCVKRKC